MSGSKGFVYVFTGEGKGKTSAALGVAVRAACVGKRVAIVQWYKNLQWDVSEFHLPEYFGDNLKIFPMGEGFHIKSSEFRVQSSEMKTAPLKGGGVVMDTASEEEHRQAARSALHLAKELLTSDSGFPLSRVARRSIQKDGDQSIVGSLNDRPTFREALGIQRSKKPDGQFPRKGNPSSQLFLLVLDEVINAVNDNLLDLPALLDLLSLRGSTHLILTGRGAPKELVDIADLVTEMKNVKHPYESGKKAIRGLDF